MEIPPRLRDFQGAVGTVGNRFVVFHGLHGPVFSTALRRFLCARGKSLAARLVAAHYVGTIPDGHVSVEMFVDRHRASGQRAAELALLQLPAPIRDGHGVVLGHHALGLQREDPIQVGSGRAPKRRSWLPRLHGELVVEDAPVVFPEELVGSLLSGDPSQP